jgi:integrase
MFAYFCIYFCFTVQKSYKFCIFVILKQHTMATINFLFRSTKNEGPLTLRLLFRNNDVDHVYGSTIKLKVTKEYWTKQHNNKRLKDIAVISERNKVNETLSSIQDFILNEFDKTDASLVDKKWLEYQINQYYNPTKEPEKLPTDFISYLEKYLELKKNDISKNTIKKINVIKQLILRYIDTNKRSLSITDINADFKISFENYCLGNNYAPNTINIALKFIKTICNHAKSNGLEVSKQLSNIKSKQVDVDNIYLSFEDLEKIEKANVKAHNKHYEDAKDWLIISCYIGQRISDFMRFTDKNIRIEKGKHLLEFKQVKTGKLMTVPIHPKVLEILKKRNGKFPAPIVDQKYNQYIKQVCRIAKINENVPGSLKVEIKEDSGIYRKESGNYEKWKLVSSHIGRRSFATNFYGEIPTTYLIYVTGHSTEQMFLSYIGKSNKDLAMELTNYF